MIAFSEAAAAAGIDRVSTGLVTAARSEASSSLASWRQPW